MKNEIQNIIKYKPNQYPKLVDSLQCKMPQDAMIFGKPNVIVNFKETNDFGLMIYKSLNKYTLDELIELAEKFSSSASAQSTVMKKIFDQIEREKNENEYNRTEIQDRAGNLVDALAHFQFDLNQTQAIRMVDKIDSQSKDQSYVNTQMSKNNQHLLDTMNGIQDPNQLIYL